MAVRTHRRRPSGSAIRSEIGLRYLYEAARLGTMRAASEKLEVTTSTISRQISLLEQELDILLIERERRDVKLTEAGQAAFEYQRIRRARAAAFRARLDALRSTRRELVEVAVDHFFVSEALANVLADCVHESPHCTVRVKASGTEGAIALVEDDDAHFALIFDTLRKPRLRPRIALPQPLMAMVSPQHELSGRTSVTLRELAGSCALALPEEPYRIRRIVRWAEQIEGVLLRPELITPSITLLRNFARSGRGATLLPRFVVRDELAAGALKAVRVETRILNTTAVGLVTRAGRELTDGAHRVMGAIEAHMRTLASM